MKTELLQHDHDAFWTRYGQSSRLGRALALFRQQPRLMPYAARVAVAGAIEALKADVTLGWLSSANQLRVLEPDAILGAEWGGMAGFSASLEKVAKPGDMALEIGCGGGRVTRVARPLVAHIDAVDVSQPMLDEARDGTAGLDGIDFWVVERFGDNLGRRKYDLAFSHDVFVHFDFDEVARYACNLAVALKPGGRFVVSVYTLDEELERREYRNELMRNELHPRRARRMPGAAYDAIWKTAGFAVEGRARSDSSEYAGRRSYTHLNYQLRLQD
jgi:SAM-dependent methyltransferase